MHDDGTVNLVHRYQIVMLMHSDNPSDSRHFSLTMHRGFVVGVDVGGGAGDDVVTVTMGCCRSNDHDPHLCKFFASIQVLCHKVYCINAH